MKKLAALLLALVMVLGLAACGSGETEAEETTAHTQPTQTTEAAPTGAVYYLNFKPEQDEAWQALAAAYTAETGVPVTVHTPASGTYEEALRSEMAKAGAPTLFQVNGPVGLAGWQDQCYDLSGTQVYAHLTSDSFALGVDGAVYGIAYVFESYGIIVNRTLLAQAGYSVEQIQSFETLKAVAEDITARSAELGFAAFTSSGLDSSSAWRFNTHLANLPIYFEYQAEGVDASAAVKGTYLQAFRNIFDLYIRNSTCSGDTLSTKTGDDSRNEFLSGEAVFYQNGSWEYNLMAEKFADDELAMIPIYIGVGAEENQGLCTGTENYWCVNKTASAEDIEATLDFLNWCVTSETGTTAMANDMGFAIPFDTGVESSNLFVKQDAVYTEGGKTPVSWVFPTVPSEAWKEGLCFALTAYAADPTDANWDAVAAAFVDGWASEYAKLG